MLNLPIFFCLDLLHVAWNLVLYLQDHNRIKEWIVNYLEENNRMLC